MNHIIREAIAAATAASPCAPTSTPFKDDSLHTPAPEYQMQSSVTTSAFQVPEAPVQLKPLASKAVTLKLSIKSLALSKRDRIETEAYGAGNVHKSLFKSKDNPVRVVVAKFRAVAAHLNDNTVPWDKGERMANIMHYRDLMAELRVLIADANSYRDQLADNLDPVLDAEVDRLRDLAIEANKPHIADSTMLPTASDIRAMGVNLEMSPIPHPSTLDDPRLGSTDEEIKAFTDRLDAKATEGGKHCVNEMISAMEQSSTTLSVPVSEVTKFYPSVISNLADVAERMDRANISDDTAIKQNIDALAALASNYNDDVRVLKHSQGARDRAKSDIDALMGQMQGLV